MQKIKFKGKRVNNGEWVYGNLRLISGSAYIESCSELAISVFMDTVGQFVCLDKHGEEVYAGDKVSGYIYDACSDKLTGILQPNENPLSCWHFRSGKNRFPAPDLQHIELIKD